MKHSSPKRKFVNTAINLVISLECQSGKTTWVINKILDNQEQDHFLFTYDKNVVKEDAIAKFYEEARKRNSSPPKLITDNKELKRVFHDRQQGNYYPVVCILLGNISNFREAKIILSSSMHTGIEQVVYLDEIHRYTLGEDMKTNVQIDNFVNEMILTGQCDQVWVISATPHDIFQTSLEFSNVKVLTPYKGFYGLRDAHWEIIDKKVFKEVDARFKLYKHEGTNLGLPRELTDVLDMYLSKDTLINLNSQKLYHSWFASEVVDGGAYNGDVKSLEGNFVGKLSMAMSSTFANHNKILYWNKMGKNAQIAGIVQELGRVNGRKKPVIMTTKEVKDAVIEYLNFIEKIINQKVYSREPQARDAWCSRYVHTNPQNIPGAKHRKNRVISQMILPKEGSLETCNEYFRLKYMPKLYDQVWKNRGWGKKILEALEATDPLLYNSIKGLSYVTNTDTRTDGSIWVKRREKERVRFGKSPLNPGYVAICVRKSDEIGFESFYDLDGYLYATTFECLGTVRSLAYQDKINEAEEQARREAEKYQSSIEVSI